MVRKSACGLLAAFFAAQAAPSYAQSWRDDDGFLPKLSTEDNELAQRTAREDLEGKDPGTELAWANPRSGSSGTVKLIRNLAWQGNRCRQVVHTFSVKNEKPQQWQTILCRMKDGAWKWPEPPKRLQ